MNDILNIFFSYSSTTTYFLVVLRISGFLFAAPIFSSNFIRPTYRIFMAILLAVFIAPLLDVVPMDGVSAPIFILLAVKEVLLGLLIGVIGNILFSGVLFAGELIGMQMGLMIANVLDPITQTQTPTVGMAYNLAATLIFLSIGGLQFLIRALYESFLLLPIAYFDINPNAYLFLAQVLGNIFIIAVKVFAPIFVSLTFLNVLLGIIGRLVPQLNILLVGLPAQLMLGFIVLTASLPYFGVMFMGVIYDYLTNMIRFMEVAIQTPPM